ncbi:uncharacterized protein LOC112684416 isoform X2 [Sipha flava]|nr:uncharacterized protein LOC112684416 isoform X2 [Sipha flava]
MFIEQAKSNEIPKGAIRLTKDEVYEYMTDLIKKWPNSMEIWALKHGNPILSSAVVITNTLILNYYRQRLKLRNYGRFTLFLPVVVIPSIFSLLFQNSITTRSIVLLEDCPTCIYTQSMFIQMGTGLVYPLMGAIGGTYMFAVKMDTINFKSNGSQMIKELTTHV